MQRNINFGPTALFCVPHWNRKKISTMGVSIFLPKNIQMIFRPSQDPAIFCTWDFYSNSLIELKLMAVTSMFLDVT